tara:strand:+ start:1940 stop:2125 length:186 start_codon:yes stop_codon:yes gene_type:complete
MKLKVAVDYNVVRQREQVVEIRLTAAQAKAIVTDYFNNMDYSGRQLWLIKQKVKTLSTELV